MDWEGHDCVTAVCGRGGGGGGGVRRGCVRGV